MEFWNKGREEVWNNGMLEYWDKKLNEPSSIPFFQHTNIPIQFSVEVYIQPGSEPGDYTGRILSFYDGRGTENFVLTQWRTGLILQKEIQHLPEETYPKIGIRDALPKGVKRLFTITSGPEGTTVYIDGKPAEKRARFSLSLEKRGSPGWLILGNSPSGKRPWHGSLLGLAIYDRLLTREQVLDHFGVWEKSAASSLAGEEGIVALYPFDDRPGGRARNLAAGPDLTVPSELAVLQKNVLVPPWRDFRLTSSYLMDVATNILGFIPFGFFLSAYLRVRRDRPSHSILLLCTLAACLTSLSIELLQVYLPTRSSQFTDVICNTLGAGIGAGLAEGQRQVASRKWFEVQG